jgi:hypothetical protein
MSRKKLYCPKQFFLVVYKGVMWMDIEADEITRASMNSRHCSIRKVSIQYRCTIPSLRTRVRTDRVHANRSVFVQTELCVRHPRKQGRLCGQVFTVQG